MGFSNSSCKRLKKSVSTQLFKLRTSVNYIRFRLEFIYFMVKMFYIIEIFFFALVLYVLCLLSQKWQMLKAPLLQSSELHFSVIKCHCWFIGHIASFSTFFYRVLSTFLLILELFKTYFKTPLSGLFWRIEKCRSKI